MPACIGQFDDSRWAMLENAPPYLQLQFRWKLDEGVERLGGWGRWQR